MLKEKTIRELEALKELAEKQDNKINLSMILITLDNLKEELSEVLDYFDQRGIEIINEDVEPDCDTSDNDSKVIPFDPSKIDIKMDKITISSIISRIKNDELEFDSSFQRKAGLWNKQSWGLRFTPNVVWEDRTDAGCPLLERMWHLTGSQEGK